MNPRWLSASCVVVLTLGCARKGRQESLASSTVSSVAPSTASSTAGTAKEMAKVTSSSSAVSAEAVSGQMEPDSDALTQACESWYRQDVRLQQYVASELVEPEAPCVGCDGTGRPIAGRPMKVARPKERLLAAFRQFQLAFLLRDPAALLPILPTEGELTFVDTLEEVKHSHTAEELRKGLSRKTGMYYDLFQASLVGGDDD